MRFESFWRDCRGATLVEYTILVSFITVLVASIIACPTAYYAMSQWLSNYAFRIPLLWWPFVLASALAFVIAGLTVCYQSIRAAHVNPVETLRSE